MADRTRKRSCTEASDAERRVLVEDSRSRFNGITDLALDRDGNLYIADDLNNRIRKVDPSGVITTFAGTGKPGFSGDGGPQGLAASSGTRARQAR
jgi:hypothetical protein